MDLSVKCAEAIPCFISQSGNFKENTHLVLNPRKFKCLTFHKVNTTEIKMIPYHEQVS